MPGAHPQHRNWSFSNSGEMGSRQSPTITSEGRRSPNGRRSYQERITTVRFSQPSTGETMCTKLNRVQRTKSKPENDAELCESFLKGHCDSGNGCQYVHVPKQYLWRLLSPQVDPKTLFYHPGFNVRCYTPDMNVYYDIPSEFIYQTKGSDRYVELFNDNGDNFKDKCRLCPNLQLHGVCDNNEQCDDIHCAVADLDQFPHIATHRATKEAVARYEHMPRELIVRVYQPNTPGDGVDFPGDDVLRTAGATQYEEAFKQNSDIPTLKMQHCAHFQTKKLCRMGDGCRFLHVVSVALASPAPDEEVSIPPSPVPTTTSTFAASAPSEATTASTAANPPSTTTTPVITTPGHQLREEDIVMKAAAEMAAAAMATEELRCTGSQADNVVPGESNGRTQKYGTQAPAATLPLEPSPQSQLPQPHQSPPQTSSANPYRQQHQMAQQNPQQHQQQMFPSQYGYQPPPPPQQQSYLAYSGTAAPNPGKGAMNFVSSQQYMHQQQMFPYGYPQQQQQQQQQQQPLNQQFFPSVMTPQTQTQPPPPIRYNQQGNNNSTNQHMSGHGSGHPRYHGGRGRGGIHGGYGGQFHRQVHNNYFYNQQHHYSSNNAVPEKTPTVHLIHPEAKKIISIKLNRIYSTMADTRPHLQYQNLGSHSTSLSNNTSVMDDKLERGANKDERQKEKGDALAGPKCDPKTTKLVLCLNFLSPQGCIHGSGCDKVHIAGLEYTWPQIVAEVMEKDGKKAYSTGFFVHCYDPTLTRYYKVPSGSVYVTKGSADYVNMFNDHGDNFKMKFKLCAATLERTVCEKGEECEDIHCSLADLEMVRQSSANATHINNAEAMADVPRLPADMTVRVFNQNSNDTWRDYPGGNLLITAGARAYQKQYEQEMNCVPARKRMQHCAHFRLKDMCRLGESCRFLHVLPTEQEIQERRDAELAEAAAKAKVVVEEGDSRLEDEFSTQMK
ncbi:hypothetical protein JKF63_00068 [Porcisia hertigi]|uniref:C3H1-type domain-containing protein n=1 Tax=Porcisia hertigi TaxID=2761500 RepID=A0A836L0Q7_9TRYP|nr:hypothetical protein JKF63_00068 [Porcisia hertigi]